MAVWLVWPGLAPDEPDGRSFPDAASTVVAVALCSTTATTVDAVALGSTMEHYGASIRCYGIYQSLLMYFGAPLHLQRRGLFQTDGFR